LCGLPPPPPPPPPQTMVMGNEVSNILEWRINVPDGTLEILQPESDLVHRIWLGLKGLLGEFILKIWKFLEKARNIAVAEPKKVIHCLKVGMELSIVSLFYYMRPLYEGVRECCVGDNDSCGSS